MDSKQLRRADAESILNNQVFKDAIEAYHRHWEEQALNCATQEESFKIILAKQAAYEFIQKIEDYIDSAVVENINNDKINRLELTKSTKIVR